MINIIRYFIRKLPFVTITFSGNLELLNFSNSTFLGRIFWEGKIIWIWWRIFWWWFLFFLILFLLVFCVAVVNRVWLPLLWLLLASWILPLLLVVVPSIFVTSSICFTWIEMLLQYYCQTKLRKVCWERFYNQEITWSF